MVRMLVTGGTGFLGSAFLDKVKDHEVIATYRGTPGSQNITWLKWDLLSIEDRDSAIGQLSNIEVIVHIGGASPNRAYADGNFDATTVGTDNLLRAGKTLGVRRIVFISSLVVDFPYSGPYRESKLIAEKLVAQSGIQYTILRPETIVGPGTDFMRMARSLGSTRYFPLLGTGRTNTQPIALQDMIAMILEALRGNKTLGIFPAVGKEVLTLRSFLETIARIQGNHITFIPIPILLARTVAFIAERIMPKTGLNQERISIITHPRSYTPAAVFPAPQLSIDEMLAFLQRE